MNGHDDAPAADRPTATVLRRALKRAVDGVPLDVTEAAVLLQARGPDPTALTGIGETYRERVESLFALRAVAREHNGVQEVIVQNFRAKPGTAMRGTPHARLDEPAATIAVARVVLGPSARIQAPPNLVGDEHAAMLRAGIDDWGGVSPLTPDHVNPGHPCPGIGELAHRTAGEGFTLRERLTAHPEFVRRGDPWIDPRVLPHVTAPADPETGLAREGVVPRGLPWQSGGASLPLYGRTDLNRTVDTDADAYTLSLSEAADRAEEAWNAGATEVCVQVGIHPDLPGTVYFDIARAVKERVPDLHLHAFSPMEAANGAARAGLSTREWLTAAKEAGVDSIPGAAAEILDDEVRWILTRAKLPAATWIEVVETAHEVGLRSSSTTMMYGHVDRPDHWLHRLRVLADVQRGTGGFTEFVTLPFIPTNAPVYLAGVARPGPTARENRVVTAMARLLLHGLVPHIQTTSWVKLGTEGSTEMEMLCSGADDMGGTLMEETISRMAGSRHGLYRSVSGLETIAKAAGRPARQRTTPYGPVPAERIAAARTSDGVLPEPDGAAPGKLLPLFPTSPSAPAAASAPGCPSACRGGPAVARPE